MSRCQAIAAGCSSIPTSQHLLTRFAKKATLARRTLGLRVLLAGLSRYSSAEDPLEIIEAMEHFAVADPMISYR
jgi:hypothetical protein